MANKKALGLFAALGAGFYLLYRNYNNSPTTPTILVKLSPSDFYSIYYPIAQQDEANTGVPALFTVSQAALESDYGLDAFGNNFFGIKAGNNWNGETQILKTWESGKTGNPVTDGIKDAIIAIYPPNDPNNIFKTSYGYRVNSIFRKYASPLEGFTDHSNFLKANSRYAKAFNYSNDPYAFAQQIASAGYATAPNYYNNLANEMDTASNYV